jgi:hypothetical protein
LPDAYNIPLRSLYSRNVPNLFMAGRNISCSHVAYTSTRPMATCSAQGQAVGTAAAMCLAGGITPRQLYQDKKRLHELQQTLLRDDQTIKNRINADPLDVARKAKVTASAEAEPGGAQRLLDGHVRNYHTRQDRKEFDSGSQSPIASYPRQEGSERHQWSAPMGPDGAWIELSWDQPQRIRHIQLTFDTAFHRMVKLMASPTSTRRGKIIRGPQPETVRDYTISYQRTGGGPLVDLVSVKGNAQRLNRHDFEPVDAHSLRIHVSATNGDALARIFEIRCYA